MLWWVRDASRGRGESSERNQSDIQCDNACVTVAVQDPLKRSCAAAFNHSETARVVERDGRWHHLAVTWTAANDGLTQIYLDGAPSHLAPAPGLLHAETLHTVTCTGICLPSSAT